MTFFLNAAGTMLLAMGLFATGLWAWDVNHLPWRKTRALSMFATSLWFTGVTSAWVVNGLNEGITPYGRFFQSYAWSGRGLVGVVMVCWTILAYRQRRLDRAEKHALVAAYVNGG